MTHSKRPFPTPPLPTLQPSTQPPLPQWISSNQQPTSPQQSAAQPMDLLESIRRAGGIKFLKSTTNKTKKEEAPPKSDMMGELKSKMSARRSQVMPNLSRHIPHISSDDDSGSHGDWDSDRPSDLRKGTAEYDFEDHK